MEKILVEKKFGWKKFVKKIFVCKTSFGWKKYLVYKKYWSEDEINGWLKCLVRKKFKMEKYFGRKNYLVDNFWTEKNICQKLCLVGKTF